MAVCPVCHSAIEITAQHHGTLYTCPKCSAVFFVGWNGQPEVAEQEAEADSAPVESDGSGYSLPSNYSAESPPYSSGTSSGYSNDAQANEYSSSGSVYSNDPVSPNQASSEFQAASEEGQESEPYDFGAGTPDLFADSKLLSDPESDSKNPFAEISEFGNADTTQAAFSYTVFISGIDSAAIRASLLEALSDKKFGWEPGPLMSQMKAGVLTIRSVSAVKASILIQRIKFLPVQVSWRQDVLSGSV